MRSFPDSFHSRHFETFRRFETLAENVRANGYECIKSAQAKGVQDIGYPVFDYQDKVVAALVVPYFDFLDGSHPISAQDAHQYIKQAALDISKALGYAPE